MRLATVAFTLALAGQPVSNAAPTAAQESRRDPGAIVLLAESEGHAADAELQAALLDPDARIRAMAARVLAAGNHVEIRGSVVGAMVREKDADAGAELVRAALYLSGGQDLALIDAHAKRLGTRAVLALAEWLARAAPSNFAAALPTLVAQPGASGLGSVVAVAAAQHPTHAGEFFDTWMRLAPEHGWGELLESQYGTVRDLAAAASVLEKGLASNRPVIRDETVWFLVTALTEKQRVPAAVLDAAVRADAGDASEWERFGRELIARRHKKARTPDRSDLLETETAAGRRGLIRALGDFPELYPDERKATLKIVAVDGRALPTYRQPSRPATRTIDLPKGVVAATLLASGCQGTPGVSTVALAYWPDGRPRQITIGPASLSSTCFKAVGALSRLSFPQRDYPVTKATQTIVVPLHPTFTQCDSQPLDREPGGEFLDPKTATLPRLTREVKPDYSGRAMDQRIEGVMIITARVSGRGCVEYAEVVRSLRELDAQGLLAVTQWGFEPARVDGEGVPIYVSIELTFKLK